MPWKVLGLWQMTARLPVNVKDRSMAHYHFETIQEQPQDSKPLRVSDRLGRTRETVAKLQSHVEKAAKEVEEAKAMPEKKREESSVALDGSRRHVDQVEQEATESLANCFSPGGKGAVLKIG